MPSNEPVWRTCADCGWYATLRFYSPEMVYCEDCNQQLGETDRPVKQDLVALESDEIVSENGETLATVEWFDDVVETHTGRADGQS